MEAPQTRPKAAPSAGPDAPALLRRRGLRFVLLAHPTVQAVRFLSKVVLAWFLTSEDLGEAVFASLFALAAAQVAVFGLDEALVHAPRLDGALWRSMRALQLRLGVGAALVLAAAGLLAGGLEEHPHFGALLVALAPMTALANQAVLPTALLVRSGAYPRVFLVDLAQVVALTLVTWGGAVLGAGPYSLVLGWYANALAAVAVSARAARPFLPAGSAEPGGADAWPATRRFGAHLCGASLAALAVERLDGFVLGARLGRAALGLYELAQQVATAALGYAANLVERLVFPVLADEQRARNLGPAWREALRVVLVFLLPLHLLLALVGEELVAAVFPARWSPTGPLLAWLALAAGARSLDLVATATLKAAGRGRAVSALAWARLLLLALALAVGLPRGLLGVAQAVCASRALAALASAWAAARCVAREAGSARAAGPGVGARLAACLVWCAGVAAFAEALRGRVAAAAFVALVAGAGLVAWTLLRLAFDRPELARELAWLRARLAEARA